jgi:hypothetical protein
MTLLDEHVSLDTSGELTPVSLWRTAAGASISDELLDWPPDLFALTDLVLQRSEAYRFALSPPTGANWPPDRLGDWASAVTDAGRRWSAWIEDHDEPFPELLSAQWDVFRAAAESPLECLTDAQEWRVCEALLTVHAIADEACAGLGVALTATDGYGATYRARGRELLARKGSLSRVPVARLRVLPKVRTAPNGTSSRTLSRYVGLHDPGVETRWHKIGVRPGSQPQAERATMLLLPWPLRVRESDFRPVNGSVRSLTNEPFGYFEFAPSKALDLELVERMLIASLDEVDHVDIALLPESAVSHSEIPELAAVLARYQVGILIAGVRGPADQPGQLPRNWVHLGISTGDGWLQIRQAKHHRWSLDEGQIQQYHLGGALHPHIRWWEAMDVPRRSIQFLEGDNGVTLASLVCEDLAQIDEVAQVMRSVGPTIVITPLLDGPQLSSRWAARYASVLADDPGSAVLTLTSYGMARRSRPNGSDPSPVIALWRDPVHGTREIPLEPGAQGVLLTANGDLTVRRSGDGRHPVQNCTAYFDVGVFQVRAAGTGPPPHTPTESRPPEQQLEPEELTILISWAEAIAETLASVPEQLDRALADAAGNAPWRAAAGITELSPPLSGTIDAMRRLLDTARQTAQERTLSTVLAALDDPPSSANRGDRLAHRVLRSALEQRRARHLKLGLKPGRDETPDTNGRDNLEAAVMHAAWRT